MRQQTTRLTGQAGKTVAFHPSEIENDPDGIVYDTSHGTGASSGEQVRKCEGCRQGNAEAENG